MSELELLAVRPIVWAQAWAAATWRRVADDERGEGVISAAIAVLIFAFLGAAMWLAFKGIWEDAEARTAEQVERIGS